MERWGQEWKMTRTVVKDVKGSRGEGWEEAVGDFWGSDSKE